MKNSQTILLFHIDEKKSDKIAEMCQHLGIEVSSIVKSDYNQKLGYLAGVQGFKKESSTYSGAEFPGEMLAFSGINSNQVDLFLEEYRKAEITPIGLKAVLTPTNVSWSADQLFRELMKEHLFYLKK